MKTLPHLAIFAAAFLASCACMGAVTSVADAKDGDSVRISGVVSSVSFDEMAPRHIWFVLRTPAGNVRVCASSDEHRFDELVSLIDAEVNVCGTVGTKSPWHLFDGNYVVASGDDGILTTSSAPSVAPEFPGDPRDEDAFARHAASGDFAHRVRLTGLLVSESRKWLFMQAQCGMIVKLSMQPKAERQKCGTMVAATGFVSYDCGGPVMHDVVLAPAPEAPPVPPPEAVETTLSNAFWRARSSNDFTRRVISFTARSATAPEITHEGSVLWVEDGGQFAAVDLSKYARGWRIGRTGALLRVTGVYDPVFESNLPPGALPWFTGMTVVPLPAVGIELLNKATWTFHGMRILFFNLIVIIVLITAALIFQRILYNRRGRQLLNEQVAHVRTKAKIDERTRLATELHDAVSQTLTGVALQVDSANLVNRGENAALTKCLTTARQLLSTCRRELRDCLWDLKSRTFDEKDMTEAVSLAIAPHSGSAKTVVRFNVPRSILSESKVHCILSITRELVVNAVRHGKATKIWIAGECSDGHISFSVRDNGCGFDVASAPGPGEGHFGLKGIGERARAAKGTFSVESAPGKGTKATTTLPEGE